MAEIRIERKRRNLGWLWLLLALLIVAALAWYFLASGRDTPAPATAPPTTGALERGTLGARPHFVAALARDAGAPGVLQRRLAAAGDRHFGGSYGTQG